MAFQQPTRQSVQRPVREASLGSSSDNQRGANAVQAQSTWVLFSPTVASSSVVESISQQSQSQSQETAGRSRLSDLGSLSAEEDAELDSLDSHLADFRQSQNTQNTLNTQNTQQSNVNLPTHDGLGSFRIGTAAQEHLYAFEQFNPRRITKRRRSSLERDLGELQGPEADFIEDLERTRRIEAWRWEHSRVLLEEIQKETRRRRNSEISRRSFKAVKKESADKGKEEAATAAEDDAGDWHEQEDDSLHLRDDDDEGLWSRLTRKFMHEVMGIDDRVLSVLFGESLGDGLDDELSSTPRASNPLANPLLESLADESTDSSSSWQMRMIERIARELGMFVHTMSTHTHPGAFSTFTRVQQMPLPYAGLPVIPEAFASLDDKDTPAKSKASTKFASDITPTGTTASLPRFKPTIQALRKDAEQEEPEDEEEIPEAATPKAPASTAPAFTQDEWEQDLDIKLVFRYLRSRLFSESQSHHTHAHPRHAMSMQEAAAKAARVRQHHPLVGGRFANCAAEKSAPVPRPCSQSTRRSARRNSLTMSMSMSSRHSSRVSSRHSSRHYWDIGGSGSMIASAGPMGSWGEV